MAAQNTASPTTRQIALAQSTIIVRGVDLVMDMLQSLHPRREWRKTASGLEEVTATPWRRGGTSPGGSSFSGPIGGSGAAPGQVVNDNTGNYFIGWPETMTNAGQPQRVIWTPPEPGAERYGPPQQVGWIHAYGPGGAQILRPATAADLAHDRGGLRPPHGIGAAGIGETTGIGAVGGQTEDLAPSSKPPYTSGTGGGLDRVINRNVPNSVLTRIDGTGVPGAIPGGNTRLVGPGQTVSFARTRIVPMTARLWGMDFDDTELWSQDFLSVCETVWQGTLAHMGEPVVTSSGFTRDEKGTNGLHWQCTVNFAVQVAYPPMGEAFVTATNFGG